MATTERTKLKTLHAHWPPGTPLTSQDLAARGISADLAVHYARAGWLTRLARGVYCRPNDVLDLQPCLLLLERVVDGLHVLASDRLPISKLGPSNTKTAPPDVELTP